jgi:DNA repair protein RecO (recombination protein O)
MLYKSNGIALRAVKYGDSSLISTIFTAQHGIQAYMVQGVRSSRASQNRASSFQPGTLLELVVYHQPLKNIQRIREFQPAFIYNTVYESVIKNSIVLFSVELLLRLIPENSPLPELFNFAFDFFITLDKIPASQAANFPLFFIIQCSNICGYEIHGSYSAHTPHLNLQEGAYTAQSPAAMPYTTDEDARLLNLLLGAGDYEHIMKIELNADIRLRLIDWYIAFLQCHSQHMGNIRSLAILRMILH